MRNCFNLIPITAIFFFYIMLARAIQLSGPYDVFKLVLVIILSTMSVQPMTIQNRAKFHNS